MTGGARRWDAIVVGGGPAGATTALLLARAGTRVLLLERARFPRDKPCSEYLSPAMTAVLERLGDGILDEVERAAHAKLYGMRVVAPSGAAMLGRFMADHGHPPPRPYSFALPRTVFDTILLRAAQRAGVVVREGTAVEDLLFEGRAVAGVVARSGDGRREAQHARVVVGADGLRSVVARRLGLVRSSAPRRIAFSAHVAGVAGVDGLGELHVSARGYVGLGPIGGGVTTVALVVPLGAVRRHATDFRTRFFNELERFPGLAGRFDARRLVRAVLVTGPFARWAQRPVAAGGGAVLVGDAADFFDPFTGQGIYSAVHGAELAVGTIAPALARGAERGAPLAGPELAPYARERRRAFAGKWALERLIGVGVGWPALSNRVVGRLARRTDLADLLVGATGNFVPARRVLAPSFLGRLLW
ncbi:MAG: NAD(P)/FAD-dependent oxidoreductase [Gemmatimonadales bacterium]